MADSTHLVVTERPPAGPQRRPARLTRLMGPALVAAIAYVDPGNVATNLTAGATSGYRLVWVVVAAGLVAIEALPHTKPRITR
jgi:manganese transport protein